MFCSNEVLYITTPQIIETNNIEKIIEKIYNHILLFETRLKDLEPISFDCLYVCLCISILLNTRSSGRYVPFLLAPAEN